MIATARRMRTHKHNVASVVADIGGLTLQWLAQHDIPYDEIFFGKPWCVGIEEAENKPNTLNIFPSTTTTVAISTSHTANQYSGLLLICATTLSSPSYTWLVCFYYRGHFYIDDLAICPFQGDGALALAKQTGFYPTSVKAKVSKTQAGPGVVTASSSVAEEDSSSDQSGGGVGGGGGAVMKPTTKNHRATTGSNGNVTSREFILGAAFGAALATAVLTFAKKKA